MCDHSVTQRLKRSALLVAALTLLALGTAAQGPPFGDPPGDVVPQLVITGAEVYDRSLCADPYLCDGILLVSGRNLGDIAPFAGTVHLFIPAMGEQALTVASFDPIAQRLAAELPVGTLGLPGTFLLTVSTGQSGAKTDVFDVALEVTGVVAGPGLTGGGKAGELTLGVDFQGSGAAATVARSDHDHPGDDIVSGTVAETVVDAKLARDTEVPGIVAPYTAAYIDELFVGSVTAFAMEEPPPGWLECNGQAVSRTTYARLFARIGTAFGAGDGAATFNLPDLRGRFMRGWNHGAGLDPDSPFRWASRPGGAEGDHVGSSQKDAFGGHGHPFVGYGDSTGDLPSAEHDHEVYPRYGDHDGFAHGIPDFCFAFPTPDVGVMIGAVRPDHWCYPGVNLEPLRTAPSSSTQHSHSFTPRGHAAQVGGRETRPVNVYFMFCIKY